MKQVVLKHALEAKPKAGDFEVVDIATPDCPPGGVLARVRFVSLDPYVGTRLRGNHMGEPAPEPGRGLIPGGVVAEVVRSNSPRAAVGDIIHSMEGGWAEVVALAEGEWTPVDPNAAPLSAYAGVLGMPGLTAWAGVTQLAKVGGGDVFSVNAAAGPVGGTAGQIARLRGAEAVVGIAGGAEKCRVVEEEYGFDLCADYRRDGWKERLDGAAPDGITVHFENVGADYLADALGRMRPYGRAVLCGLAAHYHSGGPPATVSIGAVIGRRASLHGLVVYDFYDRWAEFRAEVAPWVAGGKLHIREDRVVGLENAPALMERLVAGRNVGKAVVEL